MNRERRKEIARATELLEQAKIILETARDEEQDYFDAMPEGPQGGERGSKAEQAVEQLDSAIGDLETVLESCGSAVE